MISSNAVVSFPSEHGSRLAWGDNISLRALIRLTNPYQILILINNHLGREIEPRQPRKHVERSRFATLSFAIFAFSRGYFLSGYSRRSPILLGIICRKQK